MDYFPPGYIVKVCDPRWSRWAIVDGLGQYWAGEERRWREKPSDAVLFCREMDAIEARNRHCLGGEEANTYAVTVLVTAHARRWSEKALTRHLERHRQFFIRGPAGKEGILAEIVADTLKRIEP